MSEPKRKTVSDLPILSEFGSERTPYLVANDHDNLETGVVDGYGLISSFLEDGVDPNTNYDNLNAYLSNHIVQESVTLDDVASALYDAPYQQTPTSGAEFLLYYDNGVDGSVERVPAQQYLSEYTNSYFTHENEHVDDYMRTYLNNRMPSENLDMLDEYVSNYLNNGMPSENLDNLTEYISACITLSAIDDAIRDTLPSISEHTNDYSILMYDNYYGMVGAEPLGVINHAIYDTPTYPYSEDDSYDILTYAQISENSYGITRLPVSTIVSLSAVAAALSYASTSNISDIIEDHGILMFNSSSGGYYDDVLIGTNFSEYLGEYLSEHGIDSHFFPQNFASVYDAMSEYESALSEETRFVLNADGGDSNWPRYVTLDVLMSYIKEHIVDDE